MAWINSIFCATKGAIPPCMTTFFDVDVKNGRFGSSATPIFGAEPKLVKNPSWMEKETSIHILYTVHLLCVSSFFSAISGDLRCYAPLLRFVRCHQSGSLPVKQSGTKWECTSTSSWRKDWSKIQGSFNLQIWQPDNQWSEHVAKVWFPIGPISNYLRWASAS